jgi:hypothetical protein
MEMKDTLDSTFATFFSTEPDTDKCTDCESQNGLTVLYTTEQGSSVKICPACKVKRAEESKARAARAQARIDEWAWRDAWEEG